jgi:hypothetical protein
MISEEMTFTGKHMDAYRFLKSNGDFLGFKRIRTDLIFEYRLDDEETKGRRFTVYYFISSHDDIDIPILSELDPIPN